MPPGHLAYVAKEYISMCIKLFNNVSCIKTNEGKRSCF